MFFMMRLDFQLMNCKNLCTAYLMCTKRAPQLYLLLLLFVMLIWLPPS
nr:hypothetical protein Iba_chr07aCG7440 [Ipomoea batatas]